MSYAVKRMIERRMSLGATHDSAREQVLEDLKDLQFPTDSMCETGGHTLIDGLVKYGSLAMRTNRDVRVCRTFTAMMRMHTEATEKMETKDHDTDP